MEAKTSLKQFLRLLYMSAKMDLAWLLRDSKYALICMVVDIADNIAAISTVLLIAGRIGSIGSMGFDEALFMMSYSSLLNSLYIMLGAGNNIIISRVIGRGQLDHMLIQPLPLITQLATSGFAPFSGFGNFIVGIALMSASIHRIGMSITSLWLLSLLIYLIASLAIIASMSYLSAIMAFYAPVAAEEISSTAIDDAWPLSAFPLSGMPAIIQVALLTVFPYGLISWFPSMCLLGKPPLGLSSYYPVAVAFVLSNAAGYMFKKAMNYYTMKGSNRYVPHGFRR
ncbi:MAG: ABC transporter permease [Eubacteriaceae bacterium]|nr:ABC transporter permease [Eubacteriaceae bacterium]